MTLSREKADLLRMRAALETSKDMYPFETVCQECGEIWGLHKGELCPGPSFAASANALAIRIARGEVPDIRLKFTWGGTYFLPMLEGGNHGEVMVAV